MSDNFSAMRTPKPAQYAERPTVTITPQVPDNTPGNLCGVKNGSIRGNVPSPSENRQYNAIVTILQA